MKNDGAERIAQILRDHPELNQSTLGKLAGVSKGRVSQLKEVDEWSAEVAHNLQQRPGYAYEWLRYGRGSATDLSAEDVAGGHYHHGIAIDRIENGGSMGDGEQLQPEDRVIEQIVISQDRLAVIAGRRTNYDHLKIIPALGNSMSPTLEDGDFVLVDTSKKVVDIDGIFVLRTSDRLFIKRVTFTGDDYEVTSDNTAVPRWGALAKHKNVDIVGRVIWAWNGRKL